MALPHHFGVFLFDDKASCDWNMFSTLITIDPISLVHRLANLPPLDAYGSELIEFVVPFRASDCEAPLLEKVED